MTARKRALCALRALDDAYRTRKPASRRCAPTWTPSAPTWVACAPRRRTRHAAPEQAQRNYDDGCAYDAGGEDA